MSNLDWNALRAGGSVSLVFAIPFSIAARIVADRDNSSGAASLLSLAALVGFVLGRWRRRLGTAVAAAAETRPHLRDRHLRRLPKRCSSSFAAIRGNDIRWLAAIFNLTAVAVAGLIGGALGGMMHRRGFYPSSSRASSRGSS